MPEFMRRVLAVTVEYMVMAKYWILEIEEVSVMKAQEEDVTQCLIIHDKLTILQVDCLARL
jgi:hypothetical protein